MRCKWNIVDDSVLSQWQLSTNDVRALKTKGQRIKNWKLLNSSQLEFATVVALLAFHNTRYMFSYRPCYYTHVRLYVLVLCLRLESLSVNCNMPFVCSGYYLLSTEGSCNNITHTDLYILILDYAGPHVHCSSHRSNAFKMLTSTATKCQWRSQRQNRDVT